MKKIDQPYAVHIDYLKNIFCGKSKKLKGNKYDSKRQLHHVVNEKQKIIYLFSLPAFSIFTSLPSLLYLLGSFRGFPSPLFM